MKTSVQESRLFKRDGKRPEFAKHLRHLFEAKKKFHHKADKWPPGDVKPGQENG